MHPIDERLAEANMEKIVRLGILDRNFALREKFERYLDIMKAMDVQFFSGFDNGPDVHMIYTE